MKNILMILCALFCLCACSKEEIDYREKYIGKYKFRIDYQDMHVGRYPDPLWKSQTWYFSGSVKIALNSANRVMVYWGNDTLYKYEPIFTQRNEMIVDDDGILNYPEYSGHFNMVFGPAALHNDTIIFRFEQGGAGSQYIWEVMGVKE